MKVLFLAYVNHPGNFMVNDPIADFIVRLSNAGAVHHVSVTVPFSKMKESIAQVLAREGYVGEVKRTTQGALRVGLLYKNNRPAVSGFKRLSKPSRRLYAGSKELRPVKNGKGLLVLSTPAGILTGADARKQNVGGETLFEIW